MTNYELFQKRVAELTNEELIDSANNIIRELCSTGGRSFRMTVPPSIKDSDIILSEVVQRLAKITEGKQS